MGAVTVEAAGVTGKTDKTMGMLLSGGRLPKGAVWKTIEITLPASYDNTGTGSTTGSTMDLSAHFPDRVWFAAPMSPFAINATTGALYVGLVPGTAKADGLGGFSPSDWRVRIADTATEKANAFNAGAYKFTLIACGQ